LWSIALWTRSLLRPAATKGSPYAVYVSESTHDRIDAITAARLESAGELRVAGRERAVRVYAPGPALASARRAAA